MLLEFYTPLIFNLIMIYTIHEILVLLKIAWISSRIIFWNAFLRSILDFSF